MPRARNAWLPVALFALAGCATIGGAREEPRTPDPNSRRTLTGGEVVGFTSADGAHAWLGLPFARPPTGERRWRAPDAPEAWIGTRDARAPGPACVQFANIFSGPDYEAEGVVGDEDCLYLNVFAPRFEAQAVPWGGARLPVMFWIHGGGNVAGYGGTTDGSRLALEQNVIVVTTNYRLGALGWFRHPGLAATARHGRDASGNYGTLDLIRGLEWVRDEIAAFGGDPGNVTIFGQSSGAQDVYTLLVAPGAKGLFHRAISQSGGTVTTRVEEAEAYADAGGNDFSSREVVLRLLELDGVANARAHADALSSVETAEYLRAKSARELLETYEPEPGAGIYGAPTVFRDGTVLPAAEIKDELAAGRFHRVPVLLGTNRDETKLFMVFDPEYTWRLLWLLPILRDRDRFDRDAEYHGQLWKARGADDPAAALVAAGHRDVFVYRFDWDEQGRVLLVIDLSRLVGASHALEVAFVFDSMGAGALALITGGSGENPTRDALARSMRDYWAEFARTGDPGTGGRDDQPRWAAWSQAPDGPRFVVLDTPTDGGVRMSSDAVSRAGILEGLTTDPRFADTAERCEFLGTLFTFLDITKAEYADHGCVTYPLGDAAAR